MLIFKLLLTPTLIALVSLVSRRWGPAVSGWLVGLPLTSAPVVLFLALDYGTTFAAHAAQGTLLGLISVGAFCLTYSWLSMHLNWPGSILIGWLVFFIVTAILEPFSIPLWLAFVSVVSILAIVLLLLPRQQKTVAIVQPPRWEILLRMVVATALLLVLTSLASLLGPQLSGLLTPFPMYASILAVFTHHFQDAAAARRLLRGVMIGSFTFAIFFLLVAILIERWGIVAAFSIATLVALIVHGGALFLLRQTTSLSES
jgi:hypothetical protein